MNAESSPVLGRSARKARADIIGAVRNAGHGNVAKAIGIAPNTFSEWFNGNLDRIAITLAGAGLKVVPATDLTVDPGEYRFLRRKAIKQLQRDEDEELIAGALHGDPPLLDLDPPRSQE